MDAAVTFLVKVLDGQPVLALFVGALISGVLIMPKLFNIWHAIDDIKAGSRRRQVEKEALELMKLRCEIASIRKQHRLGNEDILRAVPGEAPSSPAVTEEFELNLELPEASHAEQPTVIVEMPKSPETVTWGWLAEVQNRSHYLARSLIAVPAVLAALAVGFGGLVAITAMLAGSTVFERAGVTIFVLFILSPFISGFLALYRQYGALENRHREAGHAG